MNKLRLSIKKIGEKFSKQTETPYLTEMCRVQETMPCESEI